MAESKKPANTDPFALVSKIKTRGPAPVHLWNPPYCGEIDMLIQRDGSWLHEGRPIRRKTMVQLFASILLLDEDQHYYLVTPVEKVRIRVEDCPFVVVLMDNKGKGEAQEIQFTTNTDEVIILDKEHPLRVVEDPVTAEPHPVVDIRSGLKALIGRNVFYQLIEIAEQKRLGDELVTGVFSAGQFFELGRTPVHDETL